MVCDGRDGTSDKRSACGAPRGAHRSRSALLRSLRTTRLTANSSPVRLWRARYTCRRTGDWKSCTCTAAVGRAPVELCQAVRLHLAWLCACLACRGRSPQQRPAAG
jgi:hypothetical protein